MPSVPNDMRTQTDPSLSSRLSRLARAAQEVAAGDLSVRVSDELDDDLGTVGRSFNDMADQLQTTINTLEDMVAQRTADGLLALYLAADPVLQSPPVDAPLLADLDRRDGPLARQAVHRRRVEAEILRGLFNRHQTAAVCLAPVRPLLVVCQFN